MIRKILWPIYAGFVVYSLITLFSGTVGFSNMKALNYFKVNLVNHVEDLGMKNNKLNDEIERLTSDNDRLKVAVRPLGYIEQGEHVIKIINSNIQKDLYDFDLQYDVPTFKQKNKTILLVSTLFTVIIFVIFLFIGVIRDTFKRESF